MTDSGYDITLPLVRMAKNVNYIYDYCYHENIQKWNGRSSESRPARLDGRVVTELDAVKCIVYALSDSARWWHEYGQEAMKEQL